MDEGNPRSTDQTREQILTDHRELGQLLRELEHAESRDGLTELLSGLHAVLRRHFAREVEKDGLFEIIENRAPRHREKLQSLAVRHTELLAEIQDLTKRSQASDDSDLIDGVSAFTRHLQEHEREESDLLIDALSTDLGKGD